MSCSFSWASSFSKTATPCCLAVGAKKQHHGHALPREPGACTRRMAKGLKETPLAWLLSTVQALAGANLCAAQSPASLQALPNVCLLASPGEGGSQAAWGGQATGERRSRSRAGGAQLCAALCPVPVGKARQSPRPGVWASAAALHPSGKGSHVLSRQLAKPLGK